MSKGGSSAMTDVSVSPPTPIEVTEISDIVGEVMEIANDDDDEVLEIFNDDDDAPGKTFTSSDCRMNMSCDGRAIPVNQVATEDRQNFWADLNVMSPGHFYDMRKVKKSFASNSIV
jgi:hypothetical protein